MTITLNFAYSPDIDGFCKYPPQFVSVDIGNVHDGHQKYAHAIADACIKASKESIAKVSDELHDTDKITKGMLK